MPSSAPAIPRTLQRLWLGFFILVACGGVVAVVYTTMQNPRITDVRAQEASQPEPLPATNDVALKTPATISKAAPSSLKTEPSEQMIPALKPQLATISDFALEEPPLVYKTTQTPRLTEVRDRMAAALKAQLATDGFALGNPAFVRIVKEERELELWMKPKGADEYKIWKKWFIAAMSGRLGPKQKEGDFQAPEGFYSTNAGLLNPASNFHLSFNIGYPNTYDRAHGRTGNFLMVHGNQVSVGCFAMTDPVIEEVYLVVESAIQAGQKEVPVHVFPFRMTEARMLQAETDKSEWLPFWRDLRKAWVKFEEKKTVPKVKVDEAQKRYVVME
jgi:murein L,D-transpeptidase YafK